MNLKNTLTKFTAVTTAAVCFVSLSSLPDDCTVFAADDYIHSSGQHSGWTAVGSTLPTSSGNYYLQSNLTFNDSRVVHSIGDSGQTVNLCLNGLKMTVGSSSFVFETKGTVNIVNCKSNKSTINVGMNGQSCIANGGNLYIENCELGAKAWGVNNTGSKLTLKDCLVQAPHGVCLGGSTSTSATIKSSEIRATSYTAIDVQSQAHVTVEDCTISGIDKGINCSGELILSGTNSISCSGGYAINGNGTVKISGTNTIKSTNSYGIYCNGGSIELSGKNEITGSTAGMYIGTNKKITITGSLSNSTPISIETAVKPTDEAPVVLTDSSNTNLNDPNKFVSADNKYRVVKDPQTGQLQLTTGAELHSMSVSYNVEPSYTVVIPATVNLSQEKETKSSISVQDVSLEKGQRVKVSLTGASPIPDSTTFHVKSNSNVIDYTIKSNNQPVKIGDNLLSVTCEDGSGTAELTFSAPKITFAGTYTGTLTFTISVS